MLHHKLDAGFLDVEDFMPMGEKSHFKFKLLPFRKMARCLGMLGTEKRHEGKDPLIHANHDLLIKLAALGKGCCIAKIIDIEKFSPALGRCTNNVRRKVLACLHRIMHEETVCMGKLCL